MALNLTDNWQIAKILTDNWHLYPPIQTLYIDSNRKWKEVISPLSPGAFCEKGVFLDVLVGFRVDLGQISFNLVKNALASPQHGFLATSIAVCDILTRACAEIKILTYVLRLFDYWNFFLAFPFSPFLSFLLQWLAFYWACLGLKNF